MLNTQIPEQHILPPNHSEQRAKGDFDGEANWGHFARNRGSPLLAVSGPIELEPCSSAGGPRKLDGLETRIAGPVGWNPDRSVGSVPFRRASEEAP